MEHDLLSRLADDWPTTVRTVRCPDAGKEESEIVVDFGLRGDGGAGIGAQTLLIDDDRRGQPVEDIDLLRQTWSTWLDPTQNPPEDRPYGAKALINACMEHRYLKQFSKRTKIRRSVYEKVAANWSKLGLSGAPPKLWALEE